MKTDFLWMLVRCGPDVWRFQMGRGGAGFFGAEARFIGLSFIRSKSFPCQVSTSRLGEVLDQQHSVLAN